MADTAITVLEQLEASLMKREGALLAQLDPVRHELLVTRRLLLAARGQIPASNAEPSISARREAAPVNTGRMTMKQLVVRALAHDFPSGATAIQLLELFHSWGRTDVFRSSLSPQLSRLKGDEVIDLDGRLWTLRPDNEKGAAETAPDAEGVAAPSSDFDDI